MNSHPPRHQHEQVYQQQLEDDSDDMLEYEAQSLEQQRMNEELEAERVAMALERSESRSKYCSTLCVCC